MKIFHRELEKNRSGHFVLMADEGEDMWHVYNIISPGDELKATTFRKVQQETATGSTNNARRVKTTIRLQVETTDFDASACKLRVKGRNVQESDFIKMGGYHTLDVEPNRKFTVYKNEWDSITIERIENACDPTKHAELAAITIQEGLAYVCLITSAMTVERSKIDVNIPKKGKADDSQRKKNFLKFYEQIAASVYRHLNFEVLKAVLVASPGFLREEFLNYLMKDATEKGNKQILENRSKFVLVHSSNGFKHAIREALQDPAVAQRLSDVKAAGETRLLQQFLCLLGSTPDRAYYGYKHVKRAANNQAVEALLVSDTLFRSVDNAERRRYIALVEQVKNNGGDVKIFSSLHVTGEQLDQITGVAAVLRFSMPEIEEDDRGEDDP
ncbi:protein pelota [Hyalella azteca]|uniref:Protein pelota homolog n=1 Tax=Hyalella azteca TaxID=294128 RepID=A0A8B7PN03_HYAAZ|nr:protein pelota [Hyalella azteca]